MPTREHSIRLSPTHGINPAIPVCFYCGKEKNEVLLLGRLKGDVEAPRHAVWNKEPCGTCKGYMKQGIILISINEVLSRDDPENPYRTGGWVVVTEEAIERWLLKPPELVDAICRRRAAFIPDEVWDRIGLPRGPTGIPDMGATHV